MGYKYARGPGFNSQYAPFLLKVYSFQCNYSSYESVAYLEFKLKYSLGLGTRLIL